MLTVNGPRFTACSLATLLLIIPCCQAATLRNYGVAELDGVVDLEDTGEVKDLIKWLKDYLKGDHRPQAELEVEGRQLQQYRELSHAKERLGFLHIVKMHAQALAGNFDLHVIKYKIVQYTNDQTIQEQINFVRRGFNVWQTDEVQDFLRQNSCRIIAFEPTEEDDNDISVAFDEHIFNIKDRTSLFSGYSKKSKTIYLNDNKDLSKELIIHLIAHEAGHVLGLGHSYQTWDVMNGRLSRDQMEKNEKLTDVDKHYLLEALGCQNSLDDIFRL